MKMNTQRIRMAVMLFLGILLAPLSLQAQDVNVRANNGSCLPAVKGEGAEDQFYSLGGFALWKHNQLNLNMTTADSDGAAMLSNGQFANPANNIFKASGGVNLILGRGNLADCYVAFTLPKGYRFTGYTIVFRRNVLINNTGDGNSASFGEVTPSNWGNWRFPNNNETFKTGLNYSASAARQTITRTSTSSADMDNTLYFKLTNSNRAFITFESINLEFTAEGDYTPVTPAGTFLNRTAVDIPFSTSCVDLGSIEMREYNDDTRMSYSYENVKDLMANLTLYQADATEAGTHYDGTTGQVVRYANGGTITSNGDYFQIGAAGTTERIYYIETPTYVELNNYEKTKNPIAYRIIGAEIKYTYGQARPAHTEDVTESVFVGQKTYQTFTINATVGVWQGFQERQHTYYLTSAAGMSETASQAARWFIDDNGYIRLANDPTKYLKNQKVSGTNNRMAIVGSGDSPAKYAINANGQITLAANGNMYLCLNTSTIFGAITGVNYFQMIQNGDTKATRTLTGESKTLNVYEEQTTTLNFPAFTPSEYTLYLYDKTGTTVVDSIKVTSTTLDGSLKLDSLNNDAVKIGVKGVGLIEGTLTLQAIDPYIDQMTVECADAAVGKEDIKIEQDFYASDFSVNGGEFHFYLPEECATDRDNVKITFKDLYSNYADETYEEHHPNETHYSRYSFVKSAHFNAFGTTTNNIYSNTSEAANPRLERLKVSTVGTAPFTFNNAAEVGTNGGTLMDYPFTLQNYEGTFEELTIPVTTAVQTRTRYVFTTDETAYNIAPTTAIQHRSYAFYKIVVNIHSASYTPNVKFVPVYSETLHGTGQTDAFYGAVITAPYQEGGKTKQGFVSTDVIYQIIDGAAKATAASGEIKDKDNNTIGTYSDKDSNNKFKDSKQLLYLDYSQLAGVYQSASGTHTMDKIGTDYAKNCMVFVPAGTAAQVANVVSKTDAEGLFLAARDVILTDKEPFYSPYTIRVDAARRIEYKRQITKDGYGKVQNATIILPFAIALENGKHTNLDGTYFTLHQMQKDKAIALNGDKPYAYFPQELADVTRTEAHTPYLVNLEESQNSTEDGISFVVTQAGGTLYPTTGAKTQDGYNYFFDGETATGTVVASGGTYPAGTYTFHNQGTYAGQAIDKTKGVFYFARNRFVNSSELSKEITTVKIAPFRTYYTVTAPSGAKMAAIDVIFGEGIGDEPDGINDLDNDVDLSVKAGNGTLTIGSKVDNNVRINGINGVARYNLGMKAGEVKTVNVPAGLYIVNGVKILVK